MSGDLRYTRSQFYDGVYMSEYYVVCIQQQMVRGMRPPIASGGSICGFMGLNYTIAKFFLHSEAQETFTNIANFSEAVSSSSVHAKDTGKSLV